MPEFEYVAREQSGNEVRGVLTAANEMEVASNLAAQQLFPVRIELAQKEKAQLRYAGRRVRPRYVAIFYSQLADLLRSGVPLLRALDLLERQATNPALKLVLQDVRDQVADGVALADAMRRHPKAFSELAVSMVRAGEEGAFLEDVLKRVANFTEHQEELKSRLIGSTVYPVFLLVIGTVIVTTMVVWFVPKFEPIFQRMAQRGQLPWATTALMAVSHTLGQYGPYLLVALVGAVAFLVHYSQTEEGRYFADGLKLKMKGLGAIVRSLAIARFCRILGTLLQNGVPILQSIRIAKDATGNRVLSDAIGRAAENVQAGKSLARPLAASHQFPEDIVEMIAVGEEANNLEQVLIDIADNLERRTYRQLDLLVRLLEPVMLMVMAGVILFIVAGLLLPILQSSSIL